MLPFSVWLGQKKMNKKPIWFSYQVTFTNLLFSEHTVYINILKTLSTELQICTIFSQFCLLAKWDIRSTRESHRSISRKWDIVNKLVEIPHGDKSTVHRVARVRGHKEDRQRAVISLQSFFVCSDIVFTNTAAVTLYHSRLVTLTHFPLPQGHRNVKIWWGLARNLIPGDFQFFCLFLFLISRIPEAKASHLGT